ncbi:MAG: hypothetical protein ACM3SY_21485 [Candidatus Omnitrophota bacterium]
MESIMENINAILLSPPVLFLIFLLFSALVFTLLKRLGIKSVEQAGKNKTYACGEDAYTNRAQPNYAEFFPMAFFFTIMHVVVLVVATLPNKTMLFFPILYLVIAILALMILFRRN